MKHVQELLIIVTIFGLTTGLLGLINQSIFPLPYVEDRPILDIPEIPISLSDNDKFSKLGNTIESLFNKPENILCEKPDFPGQIVRDECHLVASVNYESNHTVILNSPYESYVGAAIDLVKELGYKVDSFSPPNGYTGDYVVVMSK